MKLEVIRFSSEKDSTSGLLFDVTGNRKFLSVALRMERLFWDYQRGLRQNKLNGSLAS